MKTLKSIITALSLVLFLSVGLNAQKFGYVNSTQLLVDMPDVKSADSQLETYQKQLVSKGETMVKSFEAKYKAYIDKANAGTLSKIEMQKEEGALATEQQKIQQYELEVQQKILTKREELYKPILAKVQAAIDAVGADGGYTMIFDTSTGALLHADSNEDLTSKIKAKL
jgi:outer membrane protein